MAVYVLNSTRRIVFINRQDQRLDKDCFGYIVHTNRCLLKPNTVKCAHLRVKLDDHNDDDNDDVIIITADH